MSGYSYNSALDYNFDIFESRERAASATAQPASPKAAPVGKPQLKVVKSPSEEKQSKVGKNTVFRSAFIIFMAMLFLSVIGLQISAGAQRYEISSKIRDAEKMITEAKTENIRLNNALNSITTIEKIDSYAVNVLGMAKCEPYQVKCVDLSGGDKVLYTASGVFSSNIFGGNN